MKRIKILCLTLIAAFTLTALAAAGASAAGPLYLVLGKLLQVGEDARAEASNLGNFTLKDSGLSVTFICTALSAPTLLLGGTPGKSDTELHYTGCTEEGKPNCDVNSLNASGGLILVPAEDELVYDGTETQAKQELPPLGDLFKPAGGGTTFVQLT